MGLIQIVYSSRPFGFEESVLSSILFTARSRNTDDDITGALICRADLYLQLLEGPEAAVDATYARIAEDNRHVEVNLLVRKPVDGRLFPNWAMRDDPARSWMWTQKEVASGAVARASEAEILAVFSRLSSEVSMAV
jgi:hypothetical protein